MNKKDQGLKNTHGVRIGDVWYGAIGGVGPCEWDVYAVGGTVVFVRPRRSVSSPTGGYASVVTPEWMWGNMRRTRKGK